MDFKKFSKAFVKKDSDSWLNIYNTYVNVRAVATLIIGFLYATFSGAQLEVFELPLGRFLSWFFYIILTIIITFISTLISKVILSFLCDIKKIRDKKIN